MNDLNLHDSPFAGRSLIEASAGTGKTWTLTALYARLLLERELSVGQILVVDADSTDGTAEPQQAPTTGADIVVTGTRITATGFNAPTPTTVIGEHHHGRREIRTIPGGGHMIAMERPDEVTAAYVDFMADLHGR